MICWESFAMVLMGFLVVWGLADSAHRKENLKAMKWYEKEGYKEGESYYCAYCDCYFVFGKTKLDPEKLIYKLCPRCAENKAFMLMAGHEKENFQEIGKALRAANRRYDELGPEDYTIGEKPFKSNVEKEIKRLLEICRNGHKQDYRGDASHENKVYEELSNLGCAFDVASNYDFKSSWNAVECVLDHLRNMCEKEDLKENS